MVKPVTKRAGDKGVKVTGGGKGVKATMTKGAKGPQFYTGVVDTVSSGDMYVKVVELEDDIFVAERNGNRALDGDTVEVRVTRHRRNGQMEGEVVRVVERSGKQYVGVLDVTEATIFVKVESRKVPDIYIHHEDGRRFVDGQKVVVKIVDWEEGRRSPVGEVVEVLGEAGDNDVEMNAIMAEFDLPWKFEPRVEEAADAISGDMTAGEIAGRRDFRGVVTFTIDPADAKDFDDALSLRKLDNGNWEAGVHIADVTHYVRSGSIVDEEAENRATSVYLVDRTVPMLPERLSNDLCSLRPNEDKLCYSAVFEINDDAEVLNEWFGRTVIRSDRRFAYEEAQAVIETGKGDYETEILKFNELAQKMRKRRFAAGAITFDREEFKFNLDENGKPTGVYHKVQKESNQLIEEFMLLANRRVAEFVGKKHAGRVAEGAAAKNSRKAPTFVYRIHDKPDEEKLLKFSDFVIRFGYYFRPDRIKDVSRQMNDIMAKIKGKSEENVISTLAIRTMAKAVYSTDNIGHYGLAFPYYTHFTSPIRRYPDMMVHRLLTHYMSGGGSVDKPKYERLCEHSSDMEVRAADAERASVKYKMAEYMQDKVGQEFNGHISGITDWGIYVELEDSLIEGMVSMRDVADDFYRFDEYIYAAVGQSSGRKFTLGDLVRIKVKGADLQRRIIDFTLVGTIDFETGRVTELPVSKLQRKGGSRGAADKSALGYKGGSKGRRAAGTGNRRRLK